MLKFALLFVSVVAFAPQVHALTLDEILHCPPAAPGTVRASEQGIVSVPTPRGGKPLTVTGLPPCFQVDANKLFSKAAMASPKGAHVDVKGQRDPKKYCGGTDECYHIQSNQHFPGLGKHVRSQLRQRRAL